MKDERYCGVSGCVRGVEVSGMCRRHYQAARRAVRAGVLTLADLEVRGLTTRRERVADQILATPERGKGGECAA
jgi:hypothetical protein